MSRRVLAVLIAVCVAALSVSAVALASSGGGSGDKRHHAAKKHHAPAKQRAIGGGILGVALDSLAQRLDVAPADLRAAVKATAQEQAPKLRAARKAHTTPDLVALKTELATSLATKLNKTPDEVLTAVRAELDARLTQAVTAGWVTQKGHDLALACFDDPASCDLKALKAEVRIFGHHKKRHAHHQHTKPTTAAPPSTTVPGSGEMTPGGRSTSTPLR
jgi:hypothetical protein